MKYIIELEDDQSVFINYNECMVNCYNKRNLNWPPWALKLYCVLSLDVTMAATITSVLIILSASSYSINFAADNIQCNYPLVCLCVHAA